MPAKINSAGISMAEVEARLPRTYFLMRGQIREAFGFARHEMDQLVAQGVFRAEYPFGGVRREQRGRRVVLCGARARFVRTQVLAAARRLWERETSP